VGIELELFGNSGSVTAPVTNTGSVIHSANLHLNVVNPMINLLFIYPGEHIQPYVEIGYGASYPSVGNGPLQGQAGTFHVTRLHDDVCGTKRVYGAGCFGAPSAGAYQFIGGVQFDIVQHFFLLTEYRYFASNYHFDTQTQSGAAGPVLNLNYHTHIVTGGIGIRF
jgi:opacity protein-like surface antigen